MDARDRPVVVELVGLAGAGKSTLARELAAGDPGVQLDLPLSRPASARAQAAAATRFALPYLRSVRGTPWFPRDQVRGLGYLRAWRTVLARGGASGRSVVLDHGPLFRLAQLDAFGPPVTSTPQFRRWWDDAVDDWLDVLDLVVWLDAPVPTLARRIRSRDQKHVLRTADDDACHRFLATYRTSYDRLLDRARQRPSPTVITLRTDEAAPPLLAERVRRALARRAHADV